MPDDPIFLSGDAVPDYLKGVELMTAGMEWPASTGPVTITLEHIADAVTAANSDPHIQVPRIKLGHTSSVNGDHPDHDPFAAIGDAEPAFGQFVNLRTANDGAVLLGDANNVIAWLAATAPATYPNRSSEATWEVSSANFDVRTAGGKRYSMVVTAVSLLGVYIPAIGDLEDLTTLIMDGPSALAASASASPPAATAAPAAVAPGSELSVSTDVIRQRFNWDWAMGDNDTELETYWWWARDIRVDDDEVIADDDEGNLWSVPYTTDGEDTVTFGEPVRVRQTFVPVSAAKVATFARPSKPQPSRQPAAAAANHPAATGRSNDPEGGANMDADVRDILVGLGLNPEEATEQQVQIATDAATQRQATDPAAGSDEPDTPEAEAGDTPAVAETPEADRVPVAAAADPIQATKDQAMTDMAAELAGMRSREQARLAAEAKTRRDQKVSAAVGKQITPAEADHYRGLYELPGDDTEAKVDALLASLPANRCPLDAKAIVPDPEADGLPAGEPLPENVSLLTRDQRAELRARRA